MDPQYNESLPLQTENCLDKVDQLFCLLDKHVNIEMIKNYSYIGYLYAIDPVTKSVILTVSADDVYCTRLIQGHAIKNITETPSPTTLKRPNRSHTPVASEEDLKTKKQSILNWLRKNLLPAEEGCGVIDVGNVTILSPYTANDICASNPVVVEQMKRILESLPE